MDSAVVLALVSVLAGAIASVAGFGIGSLLTPLLALSVGTGLAVAAVSIPHLVATGLRFVMLRQHLDWRAFRGFGLASAAGGLAGALLHGQATNPLLRTVFGCLLLLAAAGELLGLAARVRLGRTGAWIAGILSGAFGGLVGNQGGIRSAAMLGLGLPRDAFIATATATALLVDGARMPVYFVTSGAALLTIWPSIAIATAGVVLGTLVGRRSLKRIPETLFRRLLAALLAALGAYMLLAPEA